MPSATVHGPADGEGEDARAALRAASRRALRNYFVDFQAAAVSGLFGMYTAGWLAFSFLSVLGPSCSARPARQSGALIARSGPALATSMFPIQLATNGRPASGAHARDRSGVRGLKACAAARDLTLTGQADVGGRHTRVGNSLMKLFVGNLPFSVDESQVREMFEEHGTVNSFNMINDRETGRPRGFGFVEMSSGDAQKAISALNGHMLDGRAMKVNEAIERSASGGGGGGGGFRSGGGGGGGGDRGGDRGGRRW
jgi:hypothetical protein